MTIPVKVFLMFCIGLMMVSVTACKKEGPAERAGRNIDEAVDKAGKQIDRSASKAGEKIEEAGKKLKDSSKQ
jgi:hypothetical protein